MADACPECGRSDDEVTLADLVDTLRRRKKVYAWTFVGVLAVTALFTAVQDPVYESQATLLALNEREELLALLQSPLYEELVFQETRYDLDIRAELGPRDIPANQRSEITLTFSGGYEDMQGAAEWALTVLPLLEERLRNVTWAAKWEQYYEQAGKDEAKATAQLQTLVDGMRYAEVASGPSPADQEAPSVRLNMALGLVLGVMLAFFAVFGMEAAVRVRAELAAKRQER